MERARRRADRARQAGAGAARPDRRSRRGRRLRGAPAQGLSGLRRGLSRQCRGDPAASSKARYPTLHMVGRNGMHKYNNQDHAMMTAMLTAREHPGRASALRRLGRQRGRRISRGRRVRRAERARQRAAGAGEGRRRARGLGHDREKSCPRRASQRVGDSITSSARSNVAVGISMPSALAALRFTTVMNFDAPSIGRSAGLAPLRILSTKNAAWR